MKAGDLKKLFSDLIKDERLSHSYIFFGHGTEKEKLVAAKCLANFLEAGNWEAPTRVLNDSIFYDAHADGGIDLIRLASEFLWQRPAVSIRRLLVIDNAHALTLYAQNAILKIAEEPPAGALLVLLLKDPGALSPAVQSRFQRIFLAGENVVEAEVKEVGIFMKTAPAKRKEFLKTLIERTEEEPRLVDDFVRGMMMELQKDPVKNWKGLKALSRRWALMSEFNLNKRLQLEAALLEV
ncbi:MAG: hypothetical protein Q7S83_02110 [bacterium]|nr:hypothetical protein [bacterium]